MGATEECEKASGSCNYFSPVGYSTFFCILPLPSRYERPVVGSVRAPVDGFFGENDEAIKSLGNLISKFPSFFFFVLVSFFKRSVLSRSTVTCLFSTKNLMGEKL